MTAAAPRGAALSWLSRRTADERMVLLVLLLVALLDVGLVASALLVCAETAGKLC